MNAVCSVYVGSYILGGFVIVFQSVGTEAFSLLLFRASLSLGQLSLVSVLKWINVLFFLPCRKAVKLKYM